MGDGFSFATACQSRALFMQAHLGDVTKSAVLCSENHANVTPGFLRGVSKSSSALYNIALIKFQWTERIFKGFPYAVGVIKDL